MGKKAEKKSAEERARRRLTKAQLKLEVAQDKHIQARERGKQEIERARLRAAAWLAKATQRVERRAEDAARAEAALLALTKPQVPETQPDGEVTVTAPTPDAAATVVAQREVESERTRAAETVVLPEASEESPGPSADSADGFHG